MGASQKYTEEIEKRLEDNYYHYELEELVLQQLEDMPSEYSIPIAIMLEDNVNTLPIIDEYTQILGGVLKLDVPFFFEIEFIHETNDYPIFIKINEINSDKFLDYMLEEQILKSNEPILQRIYKSKSS
tara:strand:- start:819 stop:1202 length:384 start_codon:yes stop_codon:yes gene_type:complete